MEEARVEATDRTYEVIAEARRDARSLAQLAGAAMAGAEDNVEAFHLGKVAMAWQIAEKAIGDALIASECFGGSRAAGAALDGSQAE